MAGLFRISKYVFTFSSNTLFRSFNVSFCSFNCQFCNEIVSLFPTDEREPVTCIRFTVPFVFTVFLIFTLFLELSCAISLLLAFLVFILTLTFGLGCSTTDVTSPWLSGRGVGGVCSVSDLWSNCAFITRMSLGDKPVAIKPRIERLGSFPGVLFMLLLGLSQT